MGEHGRFEVKPDMTKLKLYGYQQDCIDKLIDAGDGKHLVVMATGLGKTVTFAHLPRPGRMLILSHRDELVRQPEKYFDCSFGIEKADARSSGEEVVSASVQTLVKDNRLHAFKPGEFDMVITDEAHHAVAPSYRKIVDYLEPRVHIGFTATPNRDDGRGLGKVFDDIVFERDLKWGIMNRYLTDIDCRRVYVDWKTRHVKTSMGDFAQHALSEIVNRPKTNQQVAAAYEKYATGQTLVFASSVDHAYALASLIPGAQVVDGKTPVEERREIILAFTNREIPVLVNYGVFTEGTDLPLIETVLLARPTKNQALYTQMVGRGLRKAPGKRFLRLIDCMGTSESAKLCTAPSLFGFNEDEFSDAAKKVVDGSLLGLSERVMIADDNPTGWVLRDRRVDLLGTNKTLVAWVQLPGNKHVVTAGNLTIEVTGPDAIGKYGVRYGHEPMEEAIVFNSFEDVDRCVYRVLDNSHDQCVIDTRSLWDTARAKSWADKYPTQRQLDYLVSLLPPGGLRNLDADFGSLTRRECAVLIECQKRKNEESTKEKTGSCPICGRGIKLSRSGKTWGCTSNKYSRDEGGSWWRVAGCGFQMPARFQGEKLPQRAVRQLTNTGSTYWRDQYLNLIVDGDESYIEVDLSRS